MADRKITDLTALTTPASADVLPIVDVSEAAAADKNKKITVGELFKGVPDGTAAAPSVAFTGSGTDTGIYSPGVDQVAVATNGTGRLFINSSGQVGIGTSSPGTKLEIRNDTASTFYDTTIDTSLLLSGTPGAGNGNFGGSIGFSRLDSTGRINAAIAIKQRTTDSDQCGLSFFTHSSASTGTSLNESLVITHAGSVGIGTASPQQPLEISASVPVIRLTDADGTNQYGEIQSNAGNVTISSRNDALNGAIVFRGLAANEYARIDSSGRVGIGTNVPDSLLEVRDSTASGIISRSTNTQGTNTNKALKVRNNSDTNTFSVSYRGQGYFADSVGIGTTSSSFPLHVQGSGVQEIAVGSTNAGGATIFLDGDANGDVSGGDYAYLRHNTDGNLDITNLKTGAIIFNGTGATERARIDSSGRLLVGTPTARSNFFNAGSYTPRFQLEGDAGTGTTMLSVVSSAAGLPSYLILARQKSGSIGGNTILANGDVMGNINFQASDGTQFVTGAQIYAEVDGTPGADDMPTRLVFSTTADGASTSTPRMRIEANGKVALFNSIYGQERTIGTSSFDLNTGNFWTCGAIAIPNPTNGVAGMSGLIRVTAAPTSFGSNWDFPGGSYTAPTTFPAVAPFYCVNSTTLYLGNWTEGIA